MPAEFLENYWQKKPLLVRGAVPGFGEALDRDGLLALASRDDVESRYVAHDSSTWHLDHGPFTKTGMRRWKGRWTLLVQGVNLVLPAGDQLLRKFSFIPHARLDDLMVSYATDGAGVGPHSDNYDVFLLQGSGQRRWRIGKQLDQRLIEGAPLKILRKFTPTQEWVLEPGDMLYLPPEWAHDGTAVGPCMTWSIGFRTSPTKELADQFLAFLQDRLADDNAVTGRYADPDLTIQSHPSEIGSTMIERTEALLTALRWDTSMVRDFLGVTLSEPKSHVCFSPPVSAISLRAFEKRARKNGLSLDARSRVLFSEGFFYCNGEMEAVPNDPAAQAMFIKLADDRTISPAALSTQTQGCPAMRLLYNWYRYGYLHTNLVEFQ